MTDYQALFAQKLATLNPAQKQAVETLEGPVMVVAGPGTGKTQVLTLRIGNLIRSGLAEPDQILALTYTNSAAVTMRSRLASLIGPSALRVHFHTFHDFCGLVIAECPEYFPFGADAAPLGDLERIELLESLIDTLPLDKLRPPGAPYLYLRALTGAIEDLKKESVSPAHYQELLAAEKTRVDRLIAAEQARKRPRQGQIKRLEETYAKQVELGMVYQAYAQELVRRERFDFADMILQTIRVFREQPAVLSRFQEQFQYLLADEYQDTNNSQNELLDLLASFWGEAANVFVVGDPFQSIYRFQGANLANFFGFTQRYPGAAIINLRTGYRCHDRTYELAHALTQTMSALPDAWGQGEGLRHCDHRPGLPATITAYPSREAELLDVFTQIQKLIDSGTDPDEIAVIFRKNSESRALMSVAASLNIPIQIEGGHDILASDLVAWLELMLSFLDQTVDLDEADRLVYQLWWLPFWGLDELAIIRLAHHAREKRVSLTTVWLDPSHSLWREMTEEGIPAAALQAIKDLGTRWREILSFAQTHRASEVVSVILEKLGVLTWIREQEDKIVLLQTLYTLIAQIRDWETVNPRLSVSDLRKNLTLMHRYQLRLALQDLGARQHAVTLSTAHHAKGCEWDHVFIVGFNTKVWDHARAPLHLTLPAGIVSGDDADEATQTAQEELRLVYVALTRARVQNHLSWSLAETTNNQTRDKQPADLVATFLTSHLDDGLVQTRAPALDETARTELLPALLAPPPGRDWGAATREFLRTQVPHLTLSVTMLHDYLTDVDTFIEKHLLHAPVFTTTIAQTFGTSLHRALERTLRPLTTGKTMLPLEQAEQVFREEFAREQFAPRDQEAWTQVGLDSLHAYYDQLTHQTPPVLATERHFGRTPVVMLEDIPLAGQIDRIDDLGDQTARVIDYKTGAHRSLNYLCGRIKSVPLSAREQTLPETIRTQYQRQLLFYKLLCQLDPTCPYQITSGAYHFVKLEKGKISIVNLELTDAGIQDLIALIKQVWDEIQTLQFLDPAGNASTA